MPSDIEMGDSKPTIPTPIFRPKRVNGSVEPRNELEMGIEVCRWKMILGWAQIIERRLCEKVV
jgi:hypothetical protein